MIDPQPFAPQTPASTSTPPPTADQLDSLRLAIQALEQQRPVLGDVVVDRTLAPLLEHLAALSKPPEPTASAASTASTESAAPPAPAVPTSPPESGSRLRQVSVLFLDIVGSTQLIQLLDPEEVQVVVDSALAAFTAIVTDHGGEVLRYAGDSLKVAFGGHRTVGTREDDAERAVHCGLALLAEAARRGDDVQRDHGHTGFNARVGIHTGGVVRGGGVEHDNSLSGLAVNIAARMEQSAPVGTLRISQDTWALVRGLFDAQAQAPLAVKGVDAPIISWLVQGPKPRAFSLRARGVQGQETPLIGRQTELARFEALLAALLAERTPRALTLIAEAGLGKSRLLHEFQHLLSAHSATWWLMPARSQPSGALQPYGLLRDLLARRLDIADSDSADVARDKLVKGLAPWLDQPNDPAPELLGQLIGLDFSEAPAVQRLGSDARLLRDRAVTALRLWLQRLSASDGSPVVLLLDDLHWADDASLDALMALLGTASTEASGPLLVLFCARPTLIERMPDWGRQLAQHERLTLQPLDAAQGSALTRSLLQRLDPLPAELLALIDSRAEGNPFYAEELVGMLLDQGVISTHEADSSAWHFHAERLNPQRLPTTLTGVLQARLDALDPAARRALQMASVIGPVFWDDALRALDPHGPDALPALRQKAMVQPRPSSAFDNTLEEAFQHHLLHQVSYDTVLKPQKREAHARAAAWLMQRVGDRSDEYMGITAEHHALAGSHAQSAHWFTRAAKAAAERHAYRASLHYLDRADAQAVLQSEAEPPAHRAERLTQRIMMADHLMLRDQQAQAIAALLAWSETHGVLQWTARACQAQTLFAYRTGQLQLAVAAARRGAALAERTDSAVPGALCCGNLAFMAIEARDFDTARQELARAMHWAKLARQRLAHHNDHIYEIQMLLVEAELHNRQDDVAAQSASITQALTLAGSHASPRLECVCRSAAAFLALLRADLPAATEHIDAMARRATEFNLLHSIAGAHDLRARAHLQAGQWRAAEREAAAGAEIFQAASDAVYSLKCRSVQAEALWRAGERDAAQVIWRTSALALQQRGDAIGARATRLRLADALAASGAPADIESAHQAVAAELALLQDRDALATATFDLAARLAGWRVLHRAGDPAAAGQLALAAAELQQHLSGFSEPAVRERVQHTVPWHRDVVEALAQNRTGQHPAQAAE